MNPNTQKQRTKNRKDMECRYTLELYRHSDSEHLGTVPINPDWGPVIECARFTAVRRTPAPTAALDTGSVDIEPVWDQDLGIPYVSRVKATVHGNDQVPVAICFPVACFRDLARAASSDLVEQGRLKAGERFHYVACAYLNQVPPRGHGHEPSGSRPFRVERIAHVLQFKDGSLDSFLSNATACDSVDLAQMPVFFRPEVFEECCQLMQNAGAVETGGILIGYIHRDNARPELFLEVTAQIPAEHAQQERTRLTFTAETWSAVDAAVALRKKGEMFVGWWHTHPTADWCNKCSPVRKRLCGSLDDSPGAFFSAYDVALHRAVFPRAYSVALVLSELCGKPRTPQYQLFGWHDGMLLPRSFYTLNSRCVKTGTA